MKDNGKMVCRRDLGKLEIEKGYGDKEDGRMGKKLIYDIFYLHYKHLNNLS